MLTITIPGPEFYDEETQEFSYPESFELQLEHSLVSLSKWEAIHEKPFIDREENTVDEVISYIKCMILTPVFPDDVVEMMSQEDLTTIDAYVESRQSATWFHNSDEKPRSREKLTSELIYFWMISAGVPFSCETWHLNRLFNLLKIVSVKNEKPKNRSTSDIVAERRAENERRRKLYNTKG